ncbi:winged helix-turn-helix transcriptional regulator [Aquabacterium sp.]|uniref:winged helix-turn-helix transcriptional regulator n=1 Tax=Aquabacterium sp. TaxID=1872578 RepID=UPI0035AE0C3C
MAFPWPYSASTSVTTSGGSPDNIGRKAPNITGSYTHSERIGKALDYRLTPKGRDLFPALVALAQWGDRYEEHPNGSPTRVVEIATGQEVAPMGMRSADGQSLDLKDVAIVPGPGASERDRRRLLARRTAAAPTETVGKHLPEGKLA